MPSVGTRVLRNERAPCESVETMEGDHHHEGTSNDPPMTPIERQMQVIATSIQDLAQETSRRNKELWQAIKKGPPTPYDDNQHPLQGENRSNDQETNSRQVTRRKEDEVEKTPPRTGIGRKAREAPPLKANRRRLKLHGRPNSLNDQVGRLNS